MFDLSSLRSLISGNHHGSASSKKGSEKEAPKKREDGTYVIESDTAVKLVVLGGTGCGKTSLLSRFVLNCFPSKHIPTIGIERTAVRLAHNSDLKELAPVVNISFWEVAQPEVKGKHHASIFDDADGLIFVVDSTDPKRAGEFEQWKKSIASYCNPRIPKCILATKGDEYRSSSPCPLDTLSSRNDCVFHALVSARTGKGVYEAIHKFIDEVLEQKSALLVKTKSKRQSSQLSQQQQRRYELEVMEAMSNELLQSQIPRDVYEPSSPSADVLPGGKGSKTRVKKYELMVSDETFASGKALKALIEAENEVDAEPITDSKLPPLPDDLAGMKKSNFAAGYTKTPKQQGANEAVPLLNSVHSFYSKLQSDLEAIGARTSEERRKDIERLESQRTLEYTGWEQWLRSVGGTSPSYDHLATLFLETVNKWDRLVENLNLETSWLNPTTSDQTEDYQFGYLLRNRSSAVGPATPVEVVSPTGGYSLSSSVTGTSASSFASSFTSSSSASSSLTSSGRSLPKSLGFGFRNAGRVSPGLTSPVHSTPSSSASTSPTVSHDELLLSSGLPTFS